MSQDSQRSVSREIYTLLCKVGGRRSNRDDRMVGVRVRSHWAVPALRLATHCSAVQSRNSELGAVTYIDADAGSGAPTCVRDGMSNASAVRKSGI